MATQAGFVEVGIILFLIGAAWGHWTEITAIQVGFSILFLALFGGMLFLPYVVYGRFVETPSFSVAGGLGLVGAYAVWIGVVGTRLSTTNSLMLMQPFALAFAALLLVMFVVLADGFTQWISGRRRTPQSAETGASPPSGHEPNGGSS